MFEKYEPDLDAYFEAWQESILLDQEKEELELELEEIVAQVYIDCMNYPKYFIKDKPPAVSFVEKTWEKVGHTEETQERISKIKARLIQLEAEISRRKSIMSREDKKLSLYQTMSANARNVATIN